MAARLVSARGRGFDVKAGLVIACAAVASLLLYGCAPLQPKARGERIISIDYCADQMLLGLVARGRIAAVSIEADNDSAYAAPLARGLPRVRADAESILALRPTMVVRSYAGGPRLEAALARAGVRVHTLPYVTTLNDVDAAMTSSGRALHAERAAAERLGAWRRSLARARAQPRGRGTALYMTPGDVTSGPGSFVAQLIDAAGYASYDTRPGWNRLPVEAIAAHPPSIVMRAFFDSKANEQDHWSSARHRVLGRALAERPSVDITGGEIACGNWLSGRALDRLSNAPAGTNQASTTK
ncbi:MAG: ABC transporter substrate-binding protein [Sphingopyxis sp.]